MAFEIPDDTDPIPDEWWEPLGRTLELACCLGRPQDSLLTMCDFMLMGRERRRGRPAIYLYKHRDTRRYLNIDEHLQTYRFLPPRDLTSKSHGSYRTHRRLEDALDHLRVWQFHRERLRWIEDAVYGPRDPYHDDASEQF